MTPERTSRLAILVHLKAPVAIRSASFWSESSLPRILGAAEPYASIPYSIFDFIRASYILVSDLLSAPQVRWLKCLRRFNLFLHTALR